MRWCTTSRRGRSRHWSPSGGWWTCWCGWFTRTCPPVAASCGYGSQRAAQRARRAQVQRHWGACRPPRLRHSPSQQRRGSVRRARASWGSTCRMAATAAENVAPVAKRLYPAKRTVWRAAQTNDAAPPRPARPATAPSYICDGQPGRACGAHPYISQEHGLSAGQCGPRLPRKGKDYAGHDC